MTRSARPTSMTTESFIKTRVMLQSHAQRLGWSAHSLLGRL
jgi:hypothetical protein